MLLLQVDVDADGVLNPAQFLALAKRTLGRLQKSMILPLEQCPPRITDNSGSPRQHGRHRLATTAGLKGATQQAAARLKSADPNGFGIVTFSQCVRHLALDDS